MSSHISSLCTIYKQHPQIWRPWGGMLLYGSMQDPGEGGWRDSPIHFRWQAVKVSKFIKSSSSKEHVSPISHPSDSLRLTSLGVGQPQIYLNERTHKESIQLFSFMYEAICSERPPLQNGLICPFHLLVSENPKPSSLPLWPTLWVCLCLLFGEGTPD